MSIFAISDPNKQRNIAEKSYALKVNINPEKNTIKQKIEQINYGKLIDKVRNSHQSETTNESQKGKKKSIKKDFTFNNYKKSNSTPNLKPKSLHQPSNIHLPSIKTENPEQKKEKEMMNFKSSDRSLKLPRISCELAPFQQKLTIQDMKSTNSTHLERQKFLEMLEIFESKLIDISEKTNLPKKRKQVKLKLKNKLQIVKN